MSDYTPANIAKFLGVVAAVAKELHEESVFLKYTVIELTRLAIAGETAEINFLVPQVSKDVAVERLIELREAGINIGVHIGNSDERGATNCVLRYSPEPKKPENDIFHAYYEGQSRPASESEKLAAALAKEAAPLIQVEAQAAETVPVVDAVPVQPPLRTFEAHLVIDGKSLCLDLDLADPSEVDAAVWAELISEHGYSAEAAPPKFELVEKFPRHFEYTRCMKVQMACSSTLTGFIDLEQRHAIAECSFGPAAHNQNCLDCANCGMQLTRSHRGSQPFDSEWFVIIANYYDQISDD